MMGTTSFLSSESNRVRRAIRWLPSVCVGLLSTLVVTAAQASPTTVPVSANPVSVGVNSTTNTVYVAGYSGAVDVINGSTNVLTSTISGGSQRLFLAVNPNSNKIY